MARTTNWKNGRKSSKANGRRRELRRSAARAAARANAESFGIEERLGGRPSRGILPGEPLAEGSGFLDDYAAEAEVEQFLHRELTALCVHRDDHAADGGTLVGETLQIFNPILPALDFLLIFSMSSQ